MLSKNYRFIQASPAILFSAFLTFGGLSLAAQEPNPTSGITSSQMDQGVTQRDGVYAV